MVYGLSIETPGNYNYYCEPMDGGYPYNDVKSIDETPDGGADWKGFNSGRRVHTENLPTKMYWTGGRVKIPDFNQGGCITVSARAKAVFEQFEPGVHQFVPVEIYSKKKILLDTHYILVVCNRLDSLDHDKTTMVLKHYPNCNAWVSVDDLVRRGEIDQIPHHLPHDIKAKLVFSRSQIGKHHMWHDKYGVRGPWLSDELAAALRAAGLTGLGPGLFGDGMETVA
jgi:hypothetical protein